MTVHSLKPFCRAPQEGEDHWVAGGLYTFKALGDETGNAFTLVEVLAAPGFAAPLHTHDKEEEAFYVASGEVTLYIGDEVVRATAGSFALVPRRIAHSFRFESADTRLLLLLTPGGAGHEGLFRDLGETAKRHEVPPPPTSPPDFGQLAAIAAKHGTRVVGPPPGGADR